MTTHDSDSRVADLVTQGRITPAEAERLRRALQRGRPRWDVFRSPFLYLPPARAALVALGVVLVSLLIAPLGVRFDGAFDVHRVPGAPAWSTAVLDLMVGVVLPSIVFWLAGLTVARQGRLQDTVVAIAIARLPLVLIALVAIVLVPNPPGAREMMDIVASGAVPRNLLLLSLVSFPLFLWSLVWMYFGFATNAGVRGTKAVVTFLVALVIAEGLSKVVLLSVR